MCFRNGHDLCIVLFSEKDRKGHNVQNTESLLSMNNTEIALQLHKRYQ